MVFLRLRYYKDTETYPPNPILRIKAPIVVFFHLKIKAPIVALFNLALRLSPTHSPRTRSPELLDSLGFSV